MVCRPAYLSTSLTISAQPVTLGIVIALFFQCMNALFNPANPIKANIKWGLVVHTIAMFSFFTIPVVIELTLQSYAYINNREFPGSRSGLPPGPTGYPWPKGFLAVYEFSFPLNQSLADGLLASSIFILVNWYFDVSRSSSCIVATLSTP